MLSYAESPFECAEEAIILRDCEDEDGVLWPVHTAVMEYTHSLEYLTLQRHYKMFEDLSDCLCVAERYNERGLVDKYTLKKISSTLNTVDKNR